MEADGYGFSWKDRYEVGTLCNSRIMGSALECLKAAHYASEDTSYHPSDNCCADKCMCGEGFKCTKQGECIA